ncbi:MAG: hypothetical protein K5694_05035 [Bacilli bacterium]|nr:hypothetical protein [Bacilli bacterium]
MILIVGSNNDDILYFKAKMHDAKETQILGEYHCFIGTISRNEVVLATLGCTNILASTLTSILIERYQPYIVFNVGTVFSFSNALHQGDIFLPERYYSSMVNYEAYGRYSFGQIPNFPPYLIQDTAFNSKVERLVFSITTRYVQRGYLLSGDKFTFRGEEIAAVVDDHYIAQEGLYAYDDHSFGVAMVCHLYNIPLCTIKGVSFQMGQDDQALSFRRKGLEIQPAIGKIIAKFIEDPSLED